jgi:glycosyltransferase involved in cell wall biosynthesis
MPTQTQTPIVSVIIPVDRGDRFLAEAVESVLRQTYTAYEVLVIDGGATENSRELLHPYIATERINYIYRENKNLSWMREYGLQIANGDFVIFLNPHDFLHLTALADVVACFDEQPSLGMVMSGFQMVDAQGNILSHIELWKQFPELNLETWLLHKPVNLSTIMFRREWLEEMGKFDAQFEPIEHLDLILHLTLRGCQAAWSGKITVGCQYREILEYVNLDQLEQSLNELHKNFFVNGNLPFEIVALSNRFRYEYLVWIAGICYLRGNFKGMADYLQISLAYTSLFPTEILCDWVDKLMSYAVLFSRANNSINLTQLPEWQTLIDLMIFPKKPLYSHLTIVTSNSLVKNAQNLICKTSDNLTDYTGKFTVFQISEQSFEDFGKYLESLHKLSHTELPKVSIITSVFKGDKYIEEFLKDIISQTIFPKCELILINPNSPGNEEPVIIKYLKKYPNIVYKKLESDPGLYETWNMAIGMARGEYITNANLDDRHAPQHIEKHLEWLEQHPECDVVAAPVLVTKGINETWDCHTAYNMWHQQFVHGEDEYSGIQEFFRSELDENWVKTGGVESYNFPHCMPVWRKTLHERNGYFDESEYGTSADWEFWLRCAANGAKFKLLKEPLGLYLEDPNSHNRTYKNKEIFENKIINKYLTYARNNLVFLKIETRDENAKQSIQSLASHPKLIDISSAFKGNYGNHRSGWSYALQSLSPLHNELGIWVEGFVEKKFVWGSDPGERRNNPKPYKKPWIGFIHVPPYVPKWFLSELAPKTIFSTKLWQESIEYCRGIFCLSEYHKAWLQEHLDVPISCLWHPTETPDIKFSMDAFLANPHRKLVQIGWWLRKLHSIYYVPTKRIKKGILRTGEPHIEEMFVTEKKVLNLKPDESSVEQISYLPNVDYDLFLSKNIVYVEFYDTSANNIIIECLVRNTPILVNPLPAVREYLGENYPFYFHDLEEAAKKADDIGLIEETHNYLKSHALKEKLTAEYFLKSFASSEIYRNLL